MTHSRLAEVLAMPVHATEKTRPLQRKSLQGAARMTPQQTIAGCFNARSWSADVLQIVLGFLHVGPVLVLVACHAEFAVAIGNRQRQIGLG